MSDALRLGCRSHLFFAMALAFELASPLALASTVTSCDDSSTAATTAGTLRYAIANAADGETIDFDLPPTCNGKISLQTGAITITQDDLTLQGPATIAKYVSTPTNGMLRHKGTGTLTVNNMTLYQGKYGGAGVPNAATAKGGCIYSSGNVRLSNALLDSCVITPSDGYTHYLRGGAVYTKGDLYMVSSTIQRSYAGAKGLAQSYPKGGAAYVRGKLTMLQSTISGNEVTGKIAIGGGVAFNGGATIIASTISGNQAIANGAGQEGHYNSVVSAIWAYSNYGNAGNYTLLILNSTVSGNYSYSQPGAIWSNISTVIQNSTIVQNAVKAIHYSEPYDGTLSAGLDLTGPHASFLYSSLIAQNTVQGQERDFAIRFGSLGSNEPTIAGKNNLVVAATNDLMKSYLPADTIFGECPLLKPLADNGGPTLTHAIYSESPAIDAGDNIGTIFGPTPFDQRGAPYVRESPTGFPDIGAYELQKSEIIFDTGFEGCPP